MSPMWNIRKALSLMDKPLCNKLYDEYVTLYLDGPEDNGGFISFQHFVQIHHRETYNRALAFARLQGIV